MRQGIIFPELEKSALWSLVYRELGRGENLILEDDIMSPSGPSPKLSYMLLQHDHSRRRTLHDTLAIGYCNENLHYGSHPDQSINVAHCATEFPWIGPAPVMKKPGLEMDPALYGDMNPTDYDAIDSLMYDYLPGKIVTSKEEGQTQSLCSGLHVKGVRLSCEGDIRFLGRQNSSQLRSVPSMQSS